MTRNTTLVHQEGCQPTRDGNLGKSSLPSEAFALAFGNPIAARPVPPRGQRQTVRFGPSGTALFFATILRGQARPNHTNVDCPTRSMRHLGLSQARRDRDQGHDRCNH